MCGITGILAYRGGRADPAVVATMRDRMATRGPDGVGLWQSSDGRFAFGHRRLAFIDLRDIADQPIFLDGDRMAIIFNGEIYNYRELRADLLARGHRFETESDTEVILHLYDRYGPAMLEHLRGMFTIAIWDRDKRGLFLARDPFGIKPLYYTDDGAEFRFASQVKALIAGGADLAPDPAGHAGFFLWGNVPDPHTLYRAIKALPAGHSLWIDENGAGAPKRFFALADLFHDQLAALVDGYPPRAIASDERRALLRDALADSVSHHLIADVPVGVFLSAGRDSTTIAALAVEAGAKDLHTLTLGFEEYRGTANDEAPLAEAVARQRATRHQTRWVLGADFAKERAKLLDAMDQPSIDGVNTYFVAKATREAGLKAALSGLGGDEIFAGYPSFTDVPRMVSKFGAFGTGSWLGRAARAASAPWIGRLTSPKYAGLLEYGGGWGGAYLLRRALFMPWEVERLLPPEVARPGLQELDTVARLDATAKDFGGDRLKVMALELAWYMRHQLLRDADWAGMAHSVEIRVPFVDVEFVRRIAPLLASAAPPTKADMAATPNLPLPDEILARPKTGFQVPVRDWLQGGTGERGLRGWARAAHAAMPGAFAP